MPSTERLDAFRPAGELPADRIPDIGLRPLFDRDSSGRATVVDAIARACREPGFFRIHDTGVPQPVIDILLAQMRRFFALPADPIKRAIDNRGNPGGHGWGPIGAEPAYQPGTVAHVESFDCGPRLSAYGPDEDPAAYGVYPSVWPDLPGFHEAVRAYWDAASRTGAALAGALAEALGLAPDFLTTRCTERARRALRLLHYPGLSAGAAAPGTVGISAHTDFECFTLLYQTAPGLELTEAHGGWCRVPGEPDRFTVILGDMLERWTNGTVPATGHRVAITPWPRYSVVLFFAVDPEHLIAPLPEFVSAGNPPRYPPTAQGRHIEEELARANRNRDERRP